MDGNEILMAGCMQAAATLMQRTTISYDEGAATTTADLAKKMYQELTGEPWPEERAEAVSA